MGAIKHTASTGNTQAAGAVTINVLKADSALLHQIHVEVSATPAAGTLAVAVKTPGAANYITLSGTIDLTDIALFKIEGLVESIQLTPTGFDGDKTFDVYVASGNMQ
jgi:hypothetical protein